MTLIRLLDIILLAFHTHSLYNWQCLFRQMNKLSDFFVNLQELTKWKIRSVPIHTLYSKLQYVNYCNLDTLANENAIRRPEMLSQMFIVMKVANVCLSVMVTVLPHSYSLLHTQH